MADIIILLLVLGYCAFILVRRHQKAKSGGQGGGCGCCGSCAGCSGCGGIAGQKLSEKKRS